MSHESSQLDQLAREFLDAFDRGDLDAVMDSFSDGGVYEDGYGQRFEGPEDVRGGLKILFDGTFGKPRYAVEDLFCDASAGKVLASWRCDVEMEGKPASLRGLDILHFDSAGKVTAKLAFLKAAAPLIIT